MKLSATKGTTIKGASQIHIVQELSTRLDEDSSKPPADQQLCGLGNPTERGVTDQTIITRYSAKSMRFISKYPVVSIEQSSQ
jgi:hypothetical protein